MSAIIPPKRLALRLSPSPPGSSSTDSSDSPTMRPKPPLLSLSTPNLLAGAGKRPSLKLAALSLPGSALKLAIPIKAPSHYGTALNDREDAEEDEEDGTGRWREGDQKRMAGEILKVIRGGGDALEDELSGRTRRNLVKRPGTGGSIRSDSIEGQICNFSKSAVLEDSSLDTELSQLSLDQNTHEEAVDLNEEEDEQLEVNPTTVKDLGKLGEGASGEVRKVQHLRTGLVMAKKTISTSPNPSLHKQHLRELAFMRECSNPHIVQYYGAFLEENDTQIGICMEYCEAGSLETIYKRIKAMNGRTGEKVLGKIAESVLKGLVYLHNLKIIHRDIKPSNVLVTRPGVVKLCDFGVSGELINSFAGTFVGTTFYLAPERIRGGQYTITSDVWSTALTVLEVALNRFPFPSVGEAPLNGPIELLTYLIKMDSPVKVLLADEAEGEGVKYTNAFKDFVGVCLDKNPSTRPSPQRLLSHGWIRRSIERNPPPDLGRWVRTIWGWSE